MQTWQLSIIGDMQ